ncbi:aminoglycoside phosphotransferase family protein [Devosia rhodophyticola]|uniref:Aminoglycoside phosphotransferase family protein n=1 Tax=Devosia rhodophyticola TaxID=3026423 RepID=A0ABY7YZM5_9HYPH|nr:aminoglycoside phosphotransferase family protein [Devosia rhodophyticola]WDR06523.1 aminoglycoside phosphotransferase family protein [Devosia rhodophyticola]
MKKVDGDRIDVALVRRLVGAQFPQWADLPVRPVAAGGWDNRTFHLGDTMSVRLPSAEHYVAQVEKEHEWLPRLAQQLPLPIPTPIGLGKPDPEFPAPWSIYGWIAGETALPERIADLDTLARDLAGFLKALYRADAKGGPPAGAHNFYRGGSLGIYDRETRDAIAMLADSLDARLATTIWEAALSAEWHGPPVWVHGDVSAPNLLVADGCLCAVIDFGSAGVGDYACDLTIAWTLLDASARTIFKQAINADFAFWARARGWALWKALITLADTNAPEKADAARHVLNAVFADHFEAIAR